MARRARRDTSDPESYAAEIAGKQVGAGVEVDVNEASADPSSIAMQQ